MPETTKRATLFDICRKADVSSATVSRVINNSPLVTEATRRRVRKVMRELGYRPSHAARMLARQQTETLGVILPDINSHFQALVLAGVDYEAESSRYHILTAFTHGGRDARALFQRFSEERRVDAAIFMNMEAGMDALLKSVVKQGLPLVLLDRPVPGIPSVSIDNEGGARLAIAHLLETGRTKIAFLKGPAANHDATQRLEGARMALESAGHALPAEWTWSGDFSEESGVAAVQAWAATGKPWPDAIFSCNDTMAFGVLAALRELGLRVPEDVAVVGFDNAMGAAWLGLTTVAIPVRELGGVAAQIALQLARGEAVDTGCVQIPTRLLVRASTASVV